MHRFAGFGAMLAALLAVVVPVLAADFGTADEARAMLERAAVALKADPAAAVKRFNSTDGGFRDRDLYVFCVNAADGRTVSHIDPRQIGQDVRTLKDKVGFAFGDALFAGGKEGTLSTVRYMWPRPGQTEPAAKESFVTRIGGLICGVGYYK